MAGVSRIEREAMMALGTRGDLDTLPMVEGVAVELERSAPEPLPDPLPAVPAFDHSLLPDAVRDWCDDAADGLQVPPDFTAIPAMVALAGAIGRSVAVALRQNGRWYEAPVLWGCVIGRPRDALNKSLERQ